MWEGVVLTARERTVRRKRRRRVRAIAVMRKITHSWCPLRRRRGRVAVERAAR